MASINPTCLVNPTALHSMGERSPPTSRGPRRPPPRPPQVPGPSASSRHHAIAERKAFSSSSLPFSQESTSTADRRGSSANSSPRLQRYELNGDIPEVRSRLSVEIATPTSSSPSSPCHASSITVTVPASPKRANIPASPNKTDITSSPLRQSKYAPLPGATSSPHHSPVAKRFQQLHESEQHEGTDGETASPRISTVAQQNGTVAVGNDRAESVKREFDLEASSDSTSQRWRGSANGGAVKSEGEEDIKTSAPGLTRYNTVSGIPSPRQGKHGRSRSAGQAPVLGTVSVREPSGAVGTVSLLGHPPPPSSSCSSISQEDSSLSQDGSFTSRATLLEQLKVELFKQKTASYPCLDVQSSPRERERDEITNTLLEHIVTLKMNLTAMQEENEKLKMQRTHMDDELHTLTENLFEEAYKMVDQEKVQKFSAEKRLADTTGKLEAMETEVSALKNLLHTPSDKSSSAKASLLSVPSPQHHHRHHQRHSIKKALKKTLKKTGLSTLGRNSPSPKPQTPPLLLEHKERKGAALLEGEMDADDFTSFSQWVDDLRQGKDHPYLDGIVELDIRPCLKFENTELSEKIFQAVAKNTLVMERFSSSQEEEEGRVCGLSGGKGVCCTHRMQVGDSKEWHYISQHCRNRIAAVCDFYVYIGYIQKGIIKAEVSKMYWQIARFRALVTLSRLALSIPEEPACTPQ